MLRACSTRHVRRDSGNCPCLVLKKLGEVLWSAAIQLHGAEKTERVFSKVGWGRMGDEVKLKMGHSERILPLPLWRMWLNLGGV